MKKVVLSTVAALAVMSAAPAFAADMPVKAAKPLVVAPAPSPWDILFGVAFTTDYRLRGISQSNKNPAVQGYYEVDYKAADWLTLYTGLWGSSLWYGYASAEMDFSGGARFAWGNFGLDLGYVYYYYPGPSPLASPTGRSVSYGEFYAKPSYKVADWLTIAAVLDGGDNFNNGVGIVGSKQAYYYATNAVITLPWSPITGVTISVNPEIGRQVLKCTGCTSDTYWDVGLDFNYKAVTLDLRYWDTSLKGLAALDVVGKNVAGSTFVATLKFDTAWSQLK